jgi:hypothetical protein
MGADAALDLPPAKAGALVREPRFDHLHNFETAANGCPNATTLAMAAPVVRIWLSVQATDLRKSFDSLAERVRHSSIESI